MSKCFVDALKTLKESSKEAVENDKQFSAFKEYMHIKRKVEDELTEIILRVGKVNRKQLILVCGSVGDGKSHLMSYLKNKKKILEGFTVHNDATESFTPNMTSIETLDHVLCGFRDEHIDDGKMERVIVAINLGMLNNFIDSEIGIHYKKLAEYVEASGILESYTSEYEFNEASPFQHINFSDYHLYQLTKSGDHIDSSYIKELICKITAENPNNDFYRGYKGACVDCELANECPVKHNYEVLRNEQVQDALIDILVEAMLKNKTIISTRTLLSFLHEIIVGKSFSKVSFMNLRQEERMVVYLKSLLPNLLYGHQGKSDFLDKINQDDPMAVRSESVDETIIKFNTLDDVLSLMRGCLNHNIYLECLETLEINNMIKHQGQNGKSIEKIKPLLLKFFIRSYRLLGIEGKLDITDHTYVDFINNLYYFNSGKLPQLHNLYTNLIDAIYKWNGDATKRTVNLTIGENQFDYKLSQQMHIEELIPQSITINDRETMDKFIPYITIGVTNGRSEFEEFVDIDYALFKLISDIKNGYRPNIKDKNQFVSFVNTIERIYRYGNQKSELLVERKNVVNPEKFALKHNAFGFRFERIG